PDAFVKIAQAAGKNAWAAFKALSDDKVASLFEKYTGEFVQIAQATGENAGWAFSSLSNPTIAEMFSKDPEQAIRNFKELAPAPSHR
ncbi:MAG: hypothetical protein QXF67_03720, partial [Candidatus Anstonellales archaeon]